MFSFGFTCEPDTAKLVALQPNVLHGVAIWICRARAGLGMSAHESLGREARVAVVALLDLDLVDGEVALVVALGTFGDLAAWMKVGRR